MITQRILYIGIIVLDIIAFIVFPYYLELMYPIPEFKSKYIQLEALWFAVRGVITLAYIFIVSCSTSIVFYNLILSFISS